MDYGSRFEPPLKKFFYPGEIIHRVEGREERGRHFAGPLKGTKKEGSDMDPWEIWEDAGPSAAQIADDQYAAEVADWAGEWTRERAQGDEDDAR